jgi:hypothetical protein
MKAYISKSVHCQRRVTATTEEIWAQNRAIQLDPGLLALLHAETPYQLYEATLKVLFRYHFRYNEDYGGGIGTVKLAAFTSSSRDYDEFAERGGSDGVVIHSV